MTPEKRKKKNQGGRLLKNNYCKQQKKKKNRARVNSDGTKGTRNKAQTKAPCRRFFVFSKVVNGEGREENVIKHNIEYW